MVHAASWTMAPEHLDETVRALHDLMDVEGVSILLRAGDAWLPLLDVQEDGARVQEWEEEVEAICIEGDVSTTLHFLEGIEPGPVRVRPDADVDGIVLYVGRRPVLAIAGEEMSGLPEGLLHLEGAALPVSSLELAASLVGKTLVSLDVGGNEALTARAPDFALGFPSLQGLELSALETLEDLAPLAQLRSLRRLSLEGCSSLRDVSPLGSLRSLTHLDLSDCPQVKELQPIASLTSLVSLNLSGCEGLRSLEPLSDLPALSLLGLADCSKLPDISPLVRVLPLASLDLSGCSGLTSVAVLRACANLRTLSLKGCSRVSGLPDLAGCTHLRVLETDDEVATAHVLAGCAVRRVDPQYVREHAEAWLGLMDRVDDRAGFVEVLLPALSLGLPESWAAAAVEDLVDRVKRAGVEDHALWARIFVVLRLLGDPSWRRSVERALEDLGPGSDVMAVLEPALGMLGGLGGTHPAAAWARALADTVLDPLVTTPRARAVAAAAVKYYARAGYPNALDPWLEVLTRQTPREERLPSKRPAPRQVQDEAGDDAAALAPSFARLVQKQADSPVVAQVVTVLAGLARERPDAVVLEPLVALFAETIQRKPDSAAVARLWGAFDHVLRERGDGAIVDSALATLTGLTRTHPEHPAVEQLVQDLLDWAVLNPGSPVVARLTEMLDAARDAGLVSFGRAVLAHDALRAHAGEELEGYVSAFDVGQARRALVRGLMDALCAQDIVRNRPRAGIVAAVEEDLV